MQIIELKEKTKQWEDFLKKYEHLIAHTPEWKYFIENSFNRTEPLYLAIEEDSEIKLIFPFFTIKNSFLNKGILSSAFLEYGGPAGEAKKEYVSAILDEASKRFKDKFNYLEIRTGLLDNLLTNLKTHRAFGRFVLKLSDEETIWKHISKHKRKAVRLAGKSGITTREISFNELNLVYELYLQNMKRFGSPPYSKKYFKNFWQILSANNLAKCFGAYYKDKLVAVLTGFTVKDKVHININVSDQNYLNYRPNDAVHWVFIKWACNNNFKLFDFGRVREEAGQFRFKKKWNPELKDLNHYYLLWNIKEIPQSDPATNKEYSNYIKLLQSTPTAISRVFGPWFREGLGI